jgi:hypothetical protein
MSAEATSGMLHIAAAAADAAIKVLIRMVIPFTRQGGPVNGSEFVRATFSGTVPRPVFACCEFGEFGEADAETETAGLAWSGLVLEGWSWD